MCGFSSPALKTVRERGGGWTWFSCDRCYEPIREEVWIVPGPVSCFGTCSRCGEWESVNDLKDARPGGRRSAPTGVCLPCENGGRR